MINNKNDDYSPRGLVKSHINLDGMKEDELLVLRARIDELLPVKDLSDLNLERELMLQLRAAQALQTKVIDDQLTPANQKAQVMNSVATIIQNLVKMQLEQYTPERLKRIELALIQMLKTMPEDQTEEFFKQYEEILNGEQ